MVRGLARANIKKFFFVIIEIKIEAQDLLVVGSILAVWCAHWVTTGGANTITLKKVAHISMNFFFLSILVLFHTMSLEKERTFRSCAIRVYVAYV